LAKHFTYQGATYELIERPTFGEFAWLERQAGVPLEDMTSMERTAAIALLSLRRCQVILTWQDFQELSPVDFDYVDDEAMPDPPAADAPINS
jgi:hypothetical protein